MVFRRASTTTNALIFKALSENYLPECFENLRLPWFARDARMPFFFLFGFVVKISIDFEVLKIELRLAEDLSLKCVL